MVMSQSARPAGLAGLVVLGLLIGAASAQAAEPRFLPQPLWTQTAEASGADTAGAPNDSDDNSRNDRIGSVAVGHVSGQPGTAATHSHGGGFGTSHGGHGGGGHGGGGHGGR
jgi:hypothetical protein